jgi:hypothetical protein
MNTINETLASGGGLDTTLTAQLVAEAVRESKGNIGVLIRDIRLQHEAVLKELKIVHDSGLDLRIAYLNQSAKAAASTLGFTDGVFDTTVEQAERWRNEQGLEALIVVISESDEAKLTSLEDFVLIGPASLRKLLVQKAQHQFAEINDVLPRWWGIIGSDDQMSFYDLVDYYIALSGLDPEDVKTQAATEINMLGLLPDPAFLDDPSEKQLRTRLDQNRSLALRLANFSEDDRSKIDSALSAEKDEARRAQLQLHLRTLKEYRRGGNLTLTAADAQQLLKAKKTKTKPKPKPTPDPTSEQTKESEGVPPSSLAELAAQALLRPQDQDAYDNHDSDDDDDTAPTSLDKTIGELTTTLDGLEQTTRPEKFTIILPSGVQIDGQVQTDVLGLICRMVGEESYGGLAKVLGRDISTMVRNFQQSAEVSEPWNSEKICHIAGAFAETNSEFESIQRAFVQYNQARCSLLPLLRELLVEPLLVAVSPKSAPLISAVVDAYQHLVAEVRKHHTALNLLFAEDARVLVELILLLDTVFLDNGSSLTAILTPLHPLFLWHYSEYARVLSDQRDSLDSRDRELVRSELINNGVPLFLPSLGVPHLVSNSSPRSLPYAGRFGGLPQFSYEANECERSDGIVPIRRLLQAFIEMHPSAAEGLRVAVLEPPNAAQILLACCDLAERKDPTLTGAHVTVLRSGSGCGAELDLLPDDERRVQQRFGDHNDRRFTFQTIRVPVGALAPPPGLMAHIYIAFDQTKRLQAPAGGAPHKIQPLANRRRLAYRHTSETLDLVPEPGGILAEYLSLANLVGSETNSYPLIHQAAELRQRLKAGAQQVPWYIVADGHVDRDLDIGGLRVLTARERTRDVVAFTRSNDSFRRSLRDVVRQFNTSVTDDTLDSILRVLSDLLDAGLLALRPGRSGEIVVPQVKGILGLMVAVRHLHDNIPVGHERLVLSLDSDDARRWLHLNENQDNSRSDLLVIDGADGHFTVTIVEVKARQNLAAEYSFSDGLVSGPAIKQLLSTHRILQRVFDPSTPDLLLTPSRREVIREHLYRELSKASYDKVARRRWAELSRSLFGQGVQVELRCELIDVQLGVAATSLEPERNVHAMSGDTLVPVSLRHLNENGVPELERAITVPPPEEPPEAGVFASKSPRPDGSSGSPHGGASKHGEHIADASNETDSKGHADPEEYEGAKRPMIFIGVASGSYGPDRDIYFDPQKTNERLNNPHISITGETGTGKTQATKAILRELLPLGIPALILDFKDDYAKPDYAEAEGFTVHDASYGSLPFNPMVPPIDKMTGRVNPTAHLHEIANMLQRIYGLGDQQAFALREAIKETYSMSGVGLKPFVPDELQQYLPFEVIKNVLERNNSMTLLGRLSPVFDLGLFSEGDAALTLSQLLESPTVIRLGQLPGDQVKNAVAEFFLMALHSFLMRRDQPHALKQVLVLDEAWRLVSSPFLKPLMLEGRAFGLGVIVATQFPRQLPEEISGSTATRLFFGQTKAEQIREIQRTLVGKASGPEADHIGQVSRSLAPLECILQNAQYRPWIRVKITPYYARINDQVSS